MATASEKQEVNIDNVELRRLGAKDLDRLRLSRQPYPDSLPHHADLFLVVNTLGVAAWIAPTLDTLQFAPTASLRLAYAADSHDQASSILTKATRSVKLPLTNIHHLALASTGDILVAAATTVVALDAASLASGSAHELFRTTLSTAASDNGTITHLYPNPNPTSDTSLHLLLALTDSGTLHILNLAANGNGAILRSIQGQAITAAAWSPKGKQLVYATADRALTRIDPLSGKVAGTHPPCPPLADYDPFEDAGCHVAGLVWTDPLAIAVLSVTSDDDRMFCTAVLNWKSNSYVVSEPTPPFPANISNKAPHTYIRPVPHYPGAPNLTLVASTSSLETHTLCTAADPDDHDPNAAPQFCAVLLNENTRAVLPNDDDLEHVPVGMALDLTSHDTLPPLTPDDPRRVPAAPIVWIMTDIGEVVGWHVYEMESARQRKAYEGMVEPVVKTVEDLDKLAGQAKAAGPPPPPPVPADKPVKIASASSTLAPASPPTPSPFAFTSSSVKAPEPGKPLFGAGAATTTKPFSAFSGAAGATTSGFGAFGAAKASDDKPSKPFSFGSGAPSLAAAAAATGAAAGSKSADTKPFAFGGASPALVAGEKPAFGFGAASPNAANLFAPKPAAQHPPAPPAKAEPAPGAFGFAPPTVSPPKFEAGSKRKAEEQQVSSAKDEDQPADDDDQQDEEQDGYESESESESEESEQEQATPPPPAAPAAPQTRPRLVQRFKIQSEDADSESSGRAPTTPARPSTSSTSVRGTPRVLQIPTFTPSKSASASGLASVTEMCTNMAGTLDLLRAKRREIGLRIKDHVAVMDAWEDRAADVKEASKAVKEWQADVDSALSRALVVKDAVDRTRAKVAEIQELIKQINNPEAAGGIGEELGPEQMEGRQRIMAGLDKVRTRLRQLEAFAAQQAAEDKERRRGKGKDAAAAAAEVQEARVSLHSLHLAFKRMHEAIEARAEGVESLVLTMQMMNLVDAHNQGAAAVVGGESTILEPPTVVLASSKTAAESCSKPHPKVPGFLALLDKYRRPVDPTAAAAPAKCIQPTLPVGVGWRCSQCKVRNARLAVQCAKCSAPKVIERAPAPERDPKPEPEPVVVPVVPPPVTPAGLHVRKEPRQPVVQTIESPAAPIPGLDDVEPAQDDPTPTKKRTKRGKPNSDAMAQDPPAKGSGRSRTSSSGKPIGTKPKSLSQSSLVPSGGFSMSFAEPSKPDVSPPPPPAAAAAISGGFKLAFTKPPGWVCDTCMVNNPMDATKCTSCEAAKPGAKPAAPVAPPALTPPTSSTSGFKLSFAKPTGWTCDSCMVPNKEEAAKCVSCEAPKPGAKPAAPAFQPPPPMPAAASSSATGFKLPFAKPTGWTCDSCMVPNKEEAIKCASCETPKPGAKATMASTFVPPSTTPASGGDKAAPALPPSGSGFTFGGKPVAGPSAGFGAFSFGKSAPAAKDINSAPPALPAFGCFPPSDAGVPGYSTAAPIIPFKPPTTDAKSTLPESKQQDKHSRTPSPVPKPASPPKPSTPSSTSKHEASPSAPSSASSGAPNARTASPPSTPAPSAPATAATSTSTSESARDDDEFEQIAGFETMGESLMIGGSLVMLDKETIPESAGMDEDMEEDALDGNGNGGGAGGDAMNEAIDQSNDAFTGFSLGQPSGSAAVNSVFGGFGGQAQQQSQQQREHGASAFGWKPQGTFIGATGSKPSAFGPVSVGGGAFSGANGGSGTQSAFGGTGTSTSQSAFGGFGSTSAAPTNAFGGGATSAGPAFGQPATFGGSPAPAFGQSSSLGGSSVGFGQPSALGAGAAFGQSSSLGVNVPAFGRPSGFGAAAAAGVPTFGATSGFGAAAASTGFGAFASAGQQQQQQSSGGFGAFASQSPQSVGFGAFARSSSGQVAFGSPVSQNQQQQQRPAQPQSTPSRTGLFGFSGHRG